MEEIAVEKGLFRQFLTLFMRFITFCLKILDIFFAPRPVYAHCDVPCGIYAPHAMQIAAQTVEKMVQKLFELTPPGPQSTKEDVLAFLNSSTRIITTKEEHAQLCKKELLILWTDYFKEEHLAMFPELHTTFWKAAKLCSKNKQEINAQAAGDLRKAVDEIAQLFAKAEEAKHAH